MLREQILHMFCGKIRTVLESELVDFEKLQEIRLRVNRPVIFLQNGREYLVNEKVTERDMKDIVERICGYSGYAYEEEISRGYLTICGGHRIGFAGRAVLKEGTVQTLKYISALNFRIAHSVTGCAEQWKTYLYIGNTPCHILIVSPPGCGKTTLLRDMIRIFSNGDENFPGITVGVVDERSEIAGCYRGVQSHDLGIRTDIMDGCPKKIGMEMLLRSMSPNVLAVDEIGTADVPVIEYALRCGCKVLATLHGEMLSDYLEKPGFSSLVNGRIFERYIFLKQGQAPGKVAAIYGKNFETLWEERSCT